MASRRTKKRAVGAVSTPPAEVALPTVTWIPHLLHLPTELVLLIAGKDLGLLARMRLVCKELRRKVDRTWKKLCTTTPLTLREKKRWVSESLQAARFERYVSLDFLTPRKRAWVSLHCRKGTWRANGGGKSLSTKSLQETLRFSEELGKEILSQPGMNYELRVQASLYLLEKRGITPHQAAVLVTRELKGAVKTLTKLTLKDYLAEGYKKVSDVQNNKLYRYLTTKTYYEYDVGLPGPRTREECKEYLEKVLAELAVFDEW